jgi:hypothetical protein
MATAILSQSPDSPSLTPTSVSDGFIGSVPFPHRTLCQLSWGAATVSTAANPEFRASNPQCRQFARVKFANIPEWARDYRGTVGQYRLGGGFPRGLGVPSVYSRVSPRPPHPSPQPGLILWLFINLLGKVRPTWPTLGRMVL